MHHLITLTPVRLLMGLVFALTLTLMAPTPALAASAGPSLNGQIKSLHNQDRTKRDRVALKANSCLQRFAQAQANRQARQQRMFHQDLSPVLTKCDMRFVGENVAYGYTSASAVQKAWMNSSGHRANILQSRFRQVGVATVTAANGQIYYAVVFGQR